MHKINFSFDKLLPFSNFSHNQRWTFWWSPKFGLAIQEVLSQIPSMPICISDFIWDLRPELGSGGLRIIPSSFQGTWWYFQEIASWIATQIVTAQICLRFETWDFGLRQNVQLCAQLFIFKSKWALQLNYYYVENFSFHFSAFGELSLRLK